MAYGEYGILNPNGTKYQSVLRQFESSWRHPQDQKPKYKRVIQIVGVRPPPHIRDRYQEYRNDLECRGNFSSQGMSEGNERRRWHGTRSGYCMFLSNQLAGNGQCIDGDWCTICNIINEGVRLPEATSGCKERFGAGIYMSSTSSKCDDYTGGKVQGKRVPKKGRRALLLMKVAVGQGIKLDRRDPSLTKPPGGYDSVIGDPEVYELLNYDELVVYDEAAVLPAYIVVYE